MTWRMCSVLVLVLAACKEDDEPNYAPLTTGPATTLPIGSGTGDATEGPATESATDGMTMSTGAPEEFTVLDGAFVDGDAAVALPIECRIRFYEPGQIEPSTGVEQGGGYLFQLGGFVIDAYPQSFTVESASVPTVEIGAEGYIAAQCSTDGDSLPDGMVGGWFPALPLQRVTVPASNIFIPIIPL